MEKRAIVRALTGSVACMSLFTGCQIIIDTPQQVTKDNVTQYHQFNDWVMLASDGSELCSDLQPDCTEQAASDYLPLTLFWFQQDEVQEKAFTDVQTLPGIVSATTAPEDYQYTEWFQDMPAAYSIQFDDWCGHSSYGIYQHAFPIFQARGLVGSIGIIAGSCFPEEWQQAQEMLDAGWSVFNHSMTHTYPTAPTWDADAEITWDNQVEISDSNDVIADNLNGYRPEIIAMPTDLLTTEIDQFVRNHGDFIGMRGPNEMDNSWVSSSGMNYRFKVKPCPMGSICTGELHPMDTFFLRNDLYGPYSGFKYYGTSSLIAMVDFPINYGGWALQYNHGVEDESWESIPLDIFVEFADHLKMRKDAGEIWVATPETVVRYHHATIQCDVNKVTALPFGTLLGINQSPECLRYNTAITLQLPDNVSAQQAVQVEQPLALQTKGTYALIDFEPQSGDVAIFH